MDDTAVRTASRTRLPDLLWLLRPRQWVKNCFVLAPLVFTGAFLAPGALARALLAALVFCIASSSTYIVNDLHDLERDRRHPGKARSRPLAAGRVARREALLLLAILYCALIVAWPFAPAVLPVALAYMLLNLAYTYVLKNQPVLDIFTIALGFVLRVYAGAAALAVPLSGWMFITTLCLALYLAALKRRQELRHNGAAGRQVLEKYSAALIDRYAEMSGTGALVFYSMFVMSARPQLVVTVPLVLFGLFRYWYVVELLDGGESPTDALLEDWQLMLTGLLWTAACCWALWPD